MSSESENAPKSPEPAIVSKSSEHIYHWSKDPISREEAICQSKTGHEATLRELLRASQPHCVPTPLGAEPAVARAPASPQPYRISAWGHVLRYHSDRPIPHATTFPKDDRRPTPVASRHNAPEVTPATLHQTLHQTAKKSIQD
ncbi:hypothetical protein EDB84DRAFT_1444026 [Lactarius hengduanensis]|nr:hypothetical protein EDB84DRAFT_1444026 [Lactarius hengduanensis]